MTSLSRPRCQCSKGAHDADHTLAGRGKGHSSTRQSLTLAEATEIRANEALAGGGT